MAWAVLFALQNSSGILQNKKKMSIISWAHAPWPSEFRPACTQRRHSARRRANFLEVPFRGSVGPGTGAAHFMEWPELRHLLQSPPGSLPGSSPSPGWASGADRVQARSSRSPAPTLPPTLVLGRDETAAHFALSFLPRGLRAPCLPVTRQKVRGCAGRPRRTACPPGLPGRSAGSEPASPSPCGLQACLSPSQDVLAERGGVANMLPLLSFLCT